MEGRKIKIEEILISDEFQQTLKENVIGINIENTGTAKTYIGWNGKATKGKGVILPGASKPYGLGDPYFLDGQKINIIFDEVGNAECLLTIIYDNGLHNCSN
jgi:hypothetical protein